MPNIAFKPRPMVDPYAGKAGELLGELFQTIGQIHQLRQQRNQTNAILDIMKDPTLNDEQRQMGILNVARNGGDVLRNMIARQYMADALMPEYEKNLREQKLESERARTEYWKAGREGKSTSATELKTYKDYQGIYNSAAKQLNELNVIAEKNKIKPDPKMVERLKSQMEYGQTGMEKYSPTNKMSPETQIVSDSFNNWPDALTADRKAQEELVKQGYAKDNNEASSMVLDLVEKLPALKNKTTISKQFPSVFNQPQTTPQAPGALGGIVGPPEREGFVKPSYFAGKDFQPGEFTKEAVQPSVAQTSPPGLESIWNDLDADSRKAAMDLLAQGEPPQMLVEHFKKKRMGK